MVALMPCITERGKVKEAIVTFH